MKKCPKCSYERKPADIGEDGVCPSCGLVFSKWARRTLGTAHPRREQRQTDDSSSSWLGSLVARLTYVEPRTDPIYFWSRVAAYALFFVWGWYFILLDLRTNEIGNSFMHRVDLVFHEAGHVIFRPFGEFMHVLGGSLGQLLMPAIVIVMLVYKNQDNFGGSIGLW